MRKPSVGIRQRIVSLKHITLVEQQLHLHFYFRGYRCVIMIPSSATTPVSTPTTPVVMVTITSVVMVTTTTPVVVTATAMSIVVTATALSIVVTATTLSIVWFTVVMAVSLIVLRTSSVSVVVVRHAYVERKWLGL